MRPNIVEGAEFEEIIREYSERNEMEIENAEFEEEDDNYQFVSPRQEPTDGGVFQMRKD